MSCSRPNIIFIMTDQQRLDYTGYSGSEKLETPNMDRLTEGTAFTNCQTVNPLCSPARTALLTGRYPHQIGTLSMSGDLSLAYSTYPQALQKAGYHTIGIGKFHFLQTWPWSTERGHGVNLYELENEIKKYGFDYVWEAAGKQLAVKDYCHYCHYLEKFGFLEEYRDFCVSAGGNSNLISEWDVNNTNGSPWPFPEEHYVDNVITETALKQIEERSDDKPFFMLCSFCSPHKPFDPPESYLEKIPYEEIDNFITNGELISPEKKQKLYKMRRAYKAMIKLLDDNIGRILNKLETEGILDDTVIVFTSDHGEMLGDHMRKQKSCYYRQACTVPAMIRHPEHLSGKVISSPIEITDLSATIMDIAGLDPEVALSRDWPAFNDRIPCKSLLNIIKGKTKRLRDFSFSEYDGQWIMLQDDRYKYVRFMNYNQPGEYKELLFDLEHDPYENIDVSSNVENYDIIQQFRDRKDYVMDKTPYAQTSWAPLIKRRGIVK